MSAADDVRREMAKVESMTRDVFVGVVLEAHRSIQSGSELTGAPGQPVDTGNLRNSWQIDFETPERAAIGTNVEYAEAVEDGVGPHGPVIYGAGGKGRSTVGGSHGVKLTIANMDRIRDAVVRRTGGHP